MMKFKNQFIKTINNSEHFFITLIPILYILLLAFTAFFAHPNPEDLQKANISINCGIFNTVVDQYIISDGRYTTNFLHGFIPPVWGKPSYQYVSSLFLLLTFIFAVYFSAHSLFKLLNLKGKTAQIWTTTLLIVFCYTTSIPDLKYFMFLSPGGLVYGFSATMLLLFLNLLYKMHVEMNSIKRFYFFLLSLIILILVIGTNEMIMIFCNLLLTLFLFKTIISKSEKFQIIESITLLLICISFSLISISAFGNGMDKGDGFNSLLTIENIFFALLTSLKYTTYNMFLWITETPLSFFLPLMLIAIIKHHINLKTLLIAPVVFIIISVIIISTTNTAYILPFIDTITLDTYPTRIENTGILFFLITNIIIVFLIDNHNFKLTILNKNIILHKKHIIKYLPIFTFFLFLQHNTPMVLIKEWIDGTIPKYNLNMYNRYKKIEEAKKANHNNVSLKAIYDYPRSLTDEVIISNSEEHKIWVQSYEKYFSINITIEE